MKIDRQKVYDKYNGHCAYCGKEIEIKDMQVDHIFPKNKAHWLKSDVMKREERLNINDINDFENLNPSCRRCNHYKRAQTLREFRGTMTTIHQRIKSNYINKVGFDFGILTLKPFDGLFYFEKVIKHENS